jgi:hypothetical protein
MKDMKSMKRRIRTSALPTPLIIKTIANAMGANVRRRDDAAHVHRVFFSLRSAAGFFVWPAGAGVADG